MKKARCKVRNPIVLRISGFLIFVSFALFLFSCDQHEIFYDISREVKPKDPVIPGSPTKIVELSGKLYVSNGKSLYIYNNGAWSETGKPSGTITDVAVAGSLYCIVENKSLYRLANNQWTNIPVPGYAFIQNIYGGNTLYIGVSNGNVYSVLSYSGSNLSGPLLSGTGEGFLLRGAAGSYYAVSNGIYNGSTPISGSTGYTIMGMIQAGSTIVASTRDGKILHGSGGSFTAASFGSKFDRALAVYRRPFNSPNYLLLVGVYTNGFMEIEINNNSWNNYPPIHSPGQGDYNSGKTTAHDYAQYRSSLGIQPITGIYQASDGTLFASTQQKGLWAYQLRDEGWQWNAY
jgi:hypothetical protein